MSAFLQTSTPESLPALIDRAAMALTSAKSAAEVLEAKTLASVAYDVAKRASRLARAKEAHDSIQSAALRSQADANAIIAAAQHRLADEYDAAQERGEVALAGDTLKHGPGVPERNAGKATAADVGLSRKEIHEARIVRDAETADPGIVARSLNAMVERGEEPTRAALGRTLKAVLEPPIDADSKAEDRRVREAEAAERLRVREEQKAQLPESVRQRLDAQAGARFRASDNEIASLPTEERIAELEAENESLKAELADKDERLASLARLEEMEKLFATGGVEALIAARDRVIESKDAMIRTQGESLERWKNECLSLRKRIQAELPTTETYIDMATGEIRHV